MRKLNLIIIGFLCLALIVFGYKILESNYQRNADAIRINDVHHIASLVEQYHEKTGLYPFADESKKIGLMISINIDGKSTAETQEAVDPISQRTYSYSQFVHELQSVLGREIKVPTDPQKVSSFGPNWYVYAVQNGNYFIAAHLYHEMPEARFVESQGYYKYEVSNIEVPEKKIHKFVNQ